MRLSGWGAVRNPQAPDIKAMPTAAATQPLPRNPPRGAAILPCAGSRLNRASPLVTSAFTGPLPL